jgi:geranylgeranyl pyrophosphate synthase
VRAKALAQELYDQAIAALQPYGEQSARLVQLAQFITNRGF